MKAWLKELERALKRKFYPEEVSEIIAYYQEMIEERISNGELVDDVLLSYDIQNIVKSMTPDVILKRDNNMRHMGRSTKQLLILLLSTPVLIPLGIVYISVLIFLFSMVVVAAVLLFGSVVTFLGFIVDLWLTGQGIANWIGLVGFGLMMFSMLLILSLLIIRSTLYVSKTMMLWVIKRVKGIHEQ